MENPYQGACVVEESEWFAYGSGMKIIMMGTGPFAVPTFRELVESVDLSPTCLVTRPVPPAKGRRKGPENPMREAALELGIQIVEPQSINEEQSIQFLRELAADVFVVCDYGQILSAEALSCAQLGGINLHGSLLPRYRGAAPIQWALYHGEHTTGVSVIHMTPGLDAGPILASESTAILDEDDGISLEHRLANLGPPAVKKALNLLNDWKQIDCDESKKPGAPQDRSMVTRAPRIQKKDGAIDWQRTGRELVNQLRAFKPWPCSYTFIPSAKGQPIRVIVDQLTIIRQAEPEGSVAKPGRVVEVSENQISVASGDGVVGIDALQPAGKRLMSTGEFLRGHPVKTGSELMTNV